MAVHFHEEDLPAGVFAPGAAVAVDTETMGLVTPRDRLCVVQISDGGTRTPSGTEKHSPCAWPGPWYGSCPRITTLTWSSGVSSSARSRWPRGG